MKLTINIYITFSKMMALLVLIIGGIFSFLYNNSEVLIFSISLAGGLAGLKSWSEGLTRRKEMEMNNYNDYKDDDYNYNNQKSKKYDEIG
jgi:5-bromo-4-chloroindolyl phosphate hydrolysis protein